MWIVIGAIGALLTTFGFVPQVIKMWRSKSVKDVSAWTICQYIVGLSFWIAYGVHLGDPIVIGSNIVGVLTMVAALGLYLKYSRYY